MTTTTDAIVTALGEGPATARALSQRLDGIGYANIRQSLRRLAAAGTVTKIHRGLYTIGGVVADCDQRAPRSAAPHPRRDTRPAVDWTPALARVWADFEAMNNPRDPRAWA